MKGTFFTINTFVLYKTIIVYLIMKFSFQNKDIKLDNTIPSISWMFVSTNHYLKASNNFTSPRPSVDFHDKSDKISHIISFVNNTLAFKNSTNINNRLIDLEVIKQYFNKSEKVNAINYNNIILSANNEVISKTTFLSNLSQFFNDISSNNSINKLLFLSGICNTNLEFVYEGKEYEKYVHISYNDVKNLWMNRSNKDIKRRLFIVLDCNNSGLWVNKCNENLDYDEIIIQASSTDMETSYDIEYEIKNVELDNNNLNKHHYGSLFMNNFIHAQYIYNKEYSDKLIFNDYNSFSKLNIDIDLENKNQTSKRQPSKLINTDKITINNKIDKSLSNLLYSYKFKPSSCGAFYNTYKYYGINAMFNSWDDIIKEDYEYYERHHPEANAYYKGDFNELIKKPTGRGSLYIYASNDLHVGEFYHGEKQGMGTLIINDENPNFKNFTQNLKTNNSITYVPNPNKVAIYEGLFKNNKRVKGIMRLPYGDYYKGSFVDEVFSGKGEYYHKTKKQLYIGDFKLGMQDGYGITRYSHGGEYRGFHRNNEFNGRGSFWLNNTQLSDVEHLNGKRHGYGWFILKEGHKYTGNFKDNIPSGNGTMEFSNGDIYEGEFINGRPNGMGRYMYKSNGNTYNGQILNGKRHGKGVLNIKQSGDKYEGDFNNDVITGYGTLYYEKGIYKGQFKDGLFHGNGAIHLKNGGRYEGSFIKGKIERDEEDL